MHEIKAISDLLKIDAGQWKARDEEIAKLEEKQAQRDKLERYKKAEFRSAILMRHWIRTKLQIKCRRPQPKQLQTFYTP